MQKSHWISYLASRLKSQISLENADKAQKWALAVAAILSLGLAFGAAEGAKMRGYLDTGKILFLMMSHVVLIFGFYLPNLLHRDGKRTAAMLGMRDLSSLIFTYLTLTFVAYILMSVSSGLKGELANARGVSNFFGFIVWTNLIFNYFYLAYAAFHFSSLAFFPQAVVKLASKRTAPFIFLAVLHGVLAFFLGMSYFERNPFGSPEFFSELKTSGLYWISIVTGLLFLGKLLKDTVVPALSSLELEVAAGKIENDEDVLARLNDAFVSRRFAFWVSHLSHNSNLSAHRIAELCHEALELVDREKPTELDLRQVEDRYRKAEGVYKKVDKVNQRFLYCISLFDLNDTEVARAEVLRDQFSLELRNAKLELASVRKRIDERLVEIKNSSPALPKLAPVAEPKKISEEPKQKELTV